MAINPSLVSIKKVEDIPTVPLSELATGQMFGYTGGGDLKKVATSDLLDFVKSGIKGVATQSNAPTPYDAVTYPNGLYESYKVVEPISTSSAWYAASSSEAKLKFPITQLMLDANSITFDVKNGVVSVFKQPSISGKSAYELAVANGSFVGTLAEYLISLKGADGENKIEKYVPGNTYQSGQQVITDDGWFGVRDGMNATPTDIPSEDSLVWEVISFGNKNVEKVLEYFLEETEGIDGEFIELPAGTSYYTNNNIMLKSGSITPNANNSYIKFDVVGKDKFKFVGTKWQSPVSSDLDSFATLMGEKEGGIFDVLLSGVFTTVDPPIETYIVDCTEYKKVYLNVKNKNKGKYPVYVCETIGGKKVELNAVKKYIDLKESITSGRFDVVSFGAKGDGVTDDRVAIQNAINACFNAGGGIVYFPKPTTFYYLGTDLTPNSAVVGDKTGVTYHNAQLVIPANTDTSKIITIELKGAHRINGADEAISGVGRSSKGFIKSGLINKTASYISLIASNFQTSNIYGGKNYVRVHIENLIFRTETIEDGVHINNNMNAINMEKVIMFTFDEIKVETSSPLTDLIQQTSSYGIIMPSVGNKVILGEGTAYIVGYKNGLLLGEHFNAKRLTIVGCENGIVFPIGTNSHHSASIMHLNIEANKNNILMGSSNQVLNIFNYDTEHFYGTSFYSFENDIKKTGGTGKVNIFNSQVTRAGVGNVNNFVVSGSPNYKIMTGVGANFLP